MLVFLGVCGREAGDLMTVFSRVQDKAGKR